MGDNRLYKFQNCRILRDHKIINDYLWVRNGKIINPEKIFFEEKLQADVEIDCKGHIIAPGFIDLQINGGFGYDFSYCNETTKCVQIVAKKLLAHGVTAFCPTLVTSSKETYHTVLPNIPKTAGGRHGATVLGVHVEGPFISLEKKGAHQPECIKSYSCFEDVEAMYGSFNNISIVTLAPENNHSSEVIKKLTERGVVVSLGHSSGNLEEGERAVQAGATLITHLFNAMLPFHHRDPGLVGLLSSDQIPANKTVYFGIISDGVHTHPAALRIAHRVHPKGLVLVTDAISAMGLKDGKHNIGQFAIEIRDNKAYIAGTNTFCGSIASMVESVQFFRQATGCTVEFALETASLHPAKVLGIEHTKGTLNYGADADFIMLDSDLNLQSTWISGEQVYTTDKAHTL